MDKTFFPAKLSQETPPSVIHGWKATDLLLMMVKRKIYFRNPISRQNFANAFAETPNLNLEVRRRQLERAVIKKAKIKEKALCQYLGPQSMEDSPRAGLHTIQVWSLKYEN